jgi:arylsulfatase A-like enzyme
MCCRIKSMRSTVIYCRYHAFAFSWPTTREQEKQSWRASFFTGRYPLRTGVEAAILSYALPSSQVSPYETTTPQILAHAGYRSAMIEKFHLGGPDNNPAGSRTPSVLGWDYYNGNLQGGLPAEIGSTRRPSFLTSRDPEKNSKFLKCRPAKA